MLSARRAPALAVKLAVGGLLSFLVGAVLVAVFFAFLLPYLSGTQSEPTQVSHVEQAIALVAYALTFVGAVCASIGGVWLMLNLVKGAINAGHDYRDAQR